MRRTWFLVLLLAVASATGCTKRPRGRPAPQPPASQPQALPGTTPTTQPVTGATPQLKINVMVYFVHAPGKPDAMDLEIELPKQYTDGGKHFAPSVASVRVVGPRGPMKLTKNDFICEEAVVGGDLRSCEHRNIEGPFPGIYTVTLTTTDGQEVSGSDRYREKRVIPPPMVLAPKHGGIVSDKVPVFRWKKTAYRDVPLYYALDVMEQAPRSPGALTLRVYKSSKWIRDKLSDTVPAGLLRPGQSYKMRVRVADGSSWPRQNQSYTNWVHFTMADTLK